MKTLPRWIITSSLLILAVICYIVGSAVGIGIVVFLGVVFELSFWFRIFRKSNSSLDG